MMDIIHFKRIILELDLHWKIYVVLTINEYATKRQAFYTLAFQLLQCPHFLKNVRVCCLELPNREIVAKMICTCTS